MSNGSARVRARSKGLHLRRGSSVPDSSAVPAVSAIYREGTEMVNQVTELAGGILTVTWRSFIESRDARVKATRPTMTGDIIDEVTRQKVEELI